MKGMDKLNRNFLENNKLESDKIEVCIQDKLPVKVLQFGEGNFLRAFVDFMIDEINEKGLFNGSVTLVQPIAEGLSEMINEQDGLYTCILRGIENKRKVIRKRLITSIDSCINPYAEYDKYIEQIKNPELRFIVSNTTEAGIVYKEGENLADKPQTSFPGKVCAMLYERFKHFGGDKSKGFIFIPCELIDNNGSVLKEIVLKLAHEWQLGEDFTDWINCANYFTNTLVDRIVTGYPKDEAEEIWEELGYRDDLLVTAEIFHFFAIEAPEDVMDAISEELPFHKIGLNVVWTKDATPYKQRKVRILNGAHTMSVTGAYLADKDTVGQMMEDENFVKYLQRGIFDEIIPTLDLEKDDLDSFAHSVFDRFANPYIRHYLLSIALNSVSKYKVRVLPSILEHYNKKKEAPKILTFSMAALIAFYKGACITDGNLIGNRYGIDYKITDDLSVLTFFKDAWENHEEDLFSLTQKVLGNTEFWGHDLNALPEFTNKAALNLAGIMNHGAAAEVAAILKK